MKRYYEGHEGVYKRLRSEGENCWGRADFEDVHMLEFLKMALKKSGLDGREDLRALIVGCGTGPLACVLSRKGFRVSGIDISATAIEMAKTQANDRGLEIEYQVADLCGGPLPGGPYDLIVDSHCLHCIVVEDDRKKALEAIAQALSEEGIFILETMMGTIKGEGIVFEEGIVWTPFDEEPDFEPKKERNGKWFVPQRLLRPDGESMDRELKKNGFKILWSHVEAAESKDEPGDYQAICRRAD